LGSAYSLKYINRHVLDIAVDHSRESIVLSELEPARRDSPTRA
jgi:hypothetical protein